MTWRRYVKSLSLVDMEVEQYAVKGQAPLALARVGFSFFAGVLLFRVFVGRISRHWLTLAGGIAVVLTVAAFLLPMEPTQRIDLALVFLVFPAATLLAAWPDVRGVAAKLCGLLGVTSYALYVVHQPASVLYEALLHRVLPASVPLTPFAGWSLMILLLIGCWLLDRFYDTPVRRWLVAATAKAR